MMKVAVVKVIDVTCVLDCGVAALWTVLVPLVRMNFWVFHKKGLKQSERLLSRSKITIPNAARRPVIRQESIKF